MTSILLLLEVGSLLAVCFLVTRKTLDKTAFDSLSVALIALSLSVTLSGKMPTSRLRLTGFGGWMADLSLAIYATHWGVFTLLETHPFDSRNHYVLAGVALTLVVSAGVTWFARAVRQMKC